jgi:two-component system, sensor histidine kinase and response regulator
MEPTTLKVLVVDDEPGMQTGVERALRDYGVHIAEVNEDVRFSVEAAGSGEDALARIEGVAEPPHILLLDHMLPGMSGLAVLDRLAGKDLELLTIMITAYASLETAVTATKRGAYDFLAKPFTPAELKNVIQKAAARLLLARQARALARERHQVRFQFISVLAHELKAPLGAIEGYLNIMHDRAAGEAIADYDDAIGRCRVRVEGMRKMILDLLDLTKIESGQRTREIAPFELADVVRQTLETYRPEADGRKIALIFAPAGPLPMEGDRAELEVILNNLVSNAVKYNRDGGRVTVACAAANGVVTIAVRDTGIGMGPEDVKKLFGDFVRIKNEKTRKVMGSGLGLAILKKLAVLNGGDVKVESTLDVGTCFTVTLAQKQKRGN